MKELFEFIVNMLKSEVDGLKQIDFNLGQLDALAMDLRPALLFPCALIDISYRNCEDIGAGQQTVTGVISVKLAFECQLPTDSLAPERKRQEALSVFETVDDVFSCLQGYSNDNFGALSRKSQTPDNRYAGIKIIDMVFETAFVEYTAYHE